jgi:hypothetical protein
MAIVKRKSGGAGGVKPKPVKGTAQASKTPSAPRTSKPKVELFPVPTQRTEPSDNLGDYTWLIYGPKKIGKTSLAAQMEYSGGKALFVMFEPGGRALSLYQTPTVTDWGQMRHLISELEKDKQGYSTLVIDPGNIAYSRCLEYVSRSRGIPHPGMMKDYGASWAAVNGEFQMIHARIAALGMSFIVLAHDKEDEKERRDGTKYAKTVPVMSGSTEEFYAGVIDIICYYEFVGDRRYLRIRGDENIQAGCRLDDHFLTPAGERIIRIPAGRTAKEAFSNIRKAFANQQKQTYNVV